MNEECSVCIFSRVAVSSVEEEGPLLKCHRYPPVVIVFDGDVTQTLPDAEEWCGEWRSS